MIVLFFIIKISPNSNLKHIFHLFKKLIINLRLSLQQRESRMNTNINTNTNLHNESFLNSTSDKLLFQNSMSHNQRNSEELVRRRTKMQRISKEEEMDRYEIE